MPKFLRVEKNWMLHGNSNPKVVIAGHSHTFALLMAIKKNPKYEETFGIVAESKTEKMGKGTIRDSEYWSYTARVSAGKPTLIFWNGNQHNIHFLLDENKPFQIFEIYQEFKAAPVVPISQIRSLFNPTFDELRTNLSLFNRSSNIYLCGTPAPKSKEFIDTVIFKNEFFSEKAASLGISKSNIQATSDTLRIAMWKLTQQITQEIAFEFGCKFIPNPESTQDENGLLKNEFWTSDITHANESFGEIVLEEIIRVVGVAN